MPTAPGFEVYVSV